MTNLFLIIIIIIYLSIPGFLVKAGKPFYMGLIPIYNIYLFYKVIDVELGLLLILIGLSIIPYTSSFVLTMVYIFTPFIVCHAYSKNLLFGILGVIFPFVFYPLVGYFLGTYVYDLGELL